MTAYYVNGKKVTREEFCSRPKKGWLKHAPMASNTYTEHDPLVSDGLGCMKSQVPHLRSVIRQHGIQGARVLGNGQVEFTSRRARKELLAVRGLVDNEAGYGDG